MIDSVLDTKMVNLDMPDATKGDEVGELEEVGGGKLEETDEEFLEECGRVGFR